MKTTETEMSYVHGTSETPLVGKTLGACLKESAVQHPDAPALIIPYQGINWTYAQLNHRVDKLAAGFIALGLEPGDRVGMLAPNCFEWMLVQFATAKAGLILVNINPAYRMPELAYALERVGCRALIASETVKSSNYVSMLTALLPSLESSEPGQLRADKFPELKHIIIISDSPPPGCFSFGGLENLADESHRKKVSQIGADLQFDDVINIQFTSGTTGAPKASALTHHNIVNNAWFVGERMNLSSRDRICVPVPMYHCFGMVLGTLCAVTHGAATVFTSAGFDPLKVLETIQNERCTVLHGVPTMFIAELDHTRFNEFDMSSLRTGIMAGAPCPMALMKRVMSEMHLREITIAYGMTETGPVSFQTTVTDDISRRVSTVGQVLAHMEIKIVDENGRIVPRGTPGELLTRGYNVMPYYWNDSERTAAAIDAAGWIASGDIATLDEEGYCQIVGRSKDMLIRGGENIYPREIEDFLYQHPAIEQVEVFGVPDEKLGEEVCAWIKIHEGHTISEDEVKQYCTDKIAHFKIPKYIRFVNEFPMTVTGKVQKFVMKDIMAGELDHFPAEKPIASGTNSG